MTIRELKGKTGTYVWSEIKKIRKASLWWMIEAT